MKINARWLLCFVYLSFAASFSIAVTTPVIVPHPHDHDGIYSISWSAATDVTGIASYELQEAATSESTSDLFSDNAETGLNSWNVAGFTISTAASYSSSHSFYSGSGNNLANYISLKNPITVGGNTALSFWTKYYTESSYDYLYVQVSTNNSTWTNLGSFDGSQTTFTKKTYSLSSYSGQAVYIRLKYVTDSSVINDGVYIDNISIGNDGGYNFSTISDSLTSTSYDFSGKANGLYYYRVRAGNNSGAWGSFSDIVTVEVGPDTYAPAAPVISGPATVIGGAAIDLSWSDPGDESGVAAYELQESADSLSWLASAGAITALAYTIPGKSPGSYYYRVRAKDGAGNWSAFSSPLSVMAAASAGVDFAVSRSDAAFSPDKISEGDTLSARLVLHNVGAQGAYARVDLYRDPKDAAHLIDTNYYIYVSAVGSAETNFYFNTQGMGKNPLFYFVVSPVYSSDTDSNPANNEATVEASVISLVRPTFSYPNPFNPASQTTKFAYRLDWADWVRVIIFDVTGRIVWQRSFVAGEPGGAAGLNEVEWNGMTDYAETARNGLYIYKVIDYYSKKPLFSGKVMVLK